MRSPGSSPQRPLLRPPHRWPADDRGMDALCCAALSGFLRVLNDSEKLSAKLLMIQFSLLLCVVCGWVRACVRACVCACLGPPRPCKLYVLHIIWRVTFHPICLAACLGARSLCWRSAVTQSEILIAHNTSNHDCAEESGLLFDHFSNLCCAHKKYPSIYQTHTHSHSHSLTRMRAFIIKLQ